MGSRFNLSEWALANRPLVLYAILVFALIGAWSYARLGQSEDPPFTFKAMVIRTDWPGATADEVARQVTERIERTLLDTGQYEYIRAWSRPGQSQVIFVARDSLHSDQIPDVFYQVRKKVGDLRPRLPQGVVGPFFNDEFGDTFGNLYALSGEGFDYRTLERYAERLELALLRVPDVAKVELIGRQDEKIFIELDNTRAATLGVPLHAVQQALDEQNAVVPTGFFETPTDRVQLRVDGRFESVEQIRAFPIRVGDRTFRLEDVATVRRGFADPPAPRMRFMADDAIGLAVAMKPGGDILRLGAALEAEFARLQQTLPAGMELRKVSDQPAAVRDSVAEFVKALAEAVLIVLLVSFFSLGARTGLVVALSIPLVLAMTFAAMHYFGIGLHKISLGALVVALGLLVDDAIIAVEMMAVKMEQGFDRIRAASFAYTSTAFPMLTGTLVTAAGFLPIATAQSGTGEYTRSLFQVVTIALVISWFAAVIFIPYLGYQLLPERDAEGRETPPEGRVGRAFVRFQHAFAAGLARIPRVGAAASAHVLGGDHAHAAGHAHDPYATPFYARLRRAVAACVDHRWWVIGLTLALFVASIALFRFVPQQFFPASTRLELMVDIELHEGASLRATDAEAARLEALLAGREGVESFVAYVGTGSPRFYLPLDQQLPSPNFSQFVLRTADIQSREAVRQWLIDEVAPRFPAAQVRVTRLENGPPVGYPIQYRVSGEHVADVRRIARAVADAVRANPHVANVNLDWDEPSKVVRLSLDQDRARALGVSSAALARFLQGSLSGTSVSTYREGNALIEILLRGPGEERDNLAGLASLAVPTASGDSVRLDQVARLEYGFEDGVLWHRNRLPTVTVRADLYGRELPATVVAQLAPSLAPIRAALPPGYLLETGGTVEDSGKGMRSVAAGVPLFVLVVTTLLMLQLRSLPRVAMVWLTAPLGLVGTVLFLLVFQVPFGFVAMLGTIALSGMIMRNSLILVDQIEQDIADGRTPWDAVIEATVRRFRPIVLTALAAILAMIPLARSVFFGPMAVAIMGGLTVATGLTVLFLPALYAAWFRVRRPVAA